ncbi:MAG: ligase-associated DNA damage response exonuclease [Burkholderiales bacterium]
MASTPLVLALDRGLFCPLGDFWIDPWRPVGRAVITHAHADHLRPGCGSYLLARPGLGLARARLPQDARVETVDYGQRVVINGVHVSLHPAGHVLGSAQVRIEHRGEVWVVSGDYKLDPDPTCDPFEPLRCHTFISECTFGLPVYRWPSAASVAAELQQLRRRAAADGYALLLGAYALGKAQRVLAMLGEAAGAVALHGAVERITAAYRDGGIALPPTHAVAEFPRSHDWAGTLVIAPPSALTGPWARRFGAAPRVLASGWMTVRGTRRRRGVDAGLVLSDHADWPGLRNAIDATGAQRVLLTHGHTGPLVRTLRQSGIDADTLRTEYGGEDGSEEPAELSDIQPAQPDRAGIQP